MALPASKLIQLTVGLTVSAASRQAFGIPLILDSQNVLGSVQVKTCATIAELEALGYKSWHKAHKLARAMLAQKPKVAQFKIASVSSVSSGNLTAVEAIDSKWWALLLTTRTKASIKTAAAWVEGTATAKHVLVAETQDADAFLGGASVLADLHAAAYTRTVTFARKPKAQTQILSVSGAFVALNSTTVKVNGTAIAAPVVYGVDSDTTLAALAAAIAAVGGGLICSASPVLVGGGTTNDRQILITALDPLVDVVISDYVCTLGASQNVAEMVDYETGAVPVDAAAVGKLIPLGAGEATWFGKTLAGCVVDDLSSSELDAVATQNGNAYVNIGGKDMTFNGTCAANAAPGVALFVDLVAGIDAFEADLQTALIDALTPAKKLAYNNAGIAVVVGAINGCAQRYVGAGFLEPYEFADAFDYPDVADVTAGDKSSRILNGITASFKATGAIQALGDITVNVAA